MGFVSMSIINSLLATLGQLYYLSLVHLQSWPKLLVVDE